jgi:Ni,Fe-hydrogenase III small subunit
MFKELLARWKQGYRTHPYPKQPMPLPQRFQGCPEISSQANEKTCAAGLEICPTKAITLEQDRLTLDLGKCLFCGECETRCAPGCIHFTYSHVLAARQREDLVITADKTLPPARPLEKNRLRLFQRSFKLRQVSAGGCNACEADVNVLTTLAFDIGRFGIQFVASPRHADGLLVTGPVTKNMELALMKTYAALPEPKVVIASGACAISGGPYIDHVQACNGFAGLLPVDLFIPGCPPHPLTILDGLLRLLGRIS